MRLITDWHVHSKYSRACSQNLTLPNIAAMCERKGIDVVATGDWTHPAWFAHLKELLVESEPGMYRLSAKLLPASGIGSKFGGSKTRFMLVTEVSQIYSKGGKTRKIHNLIFSPSLETCAKVNAELDRRGFNRKSDGRPILGIDSEELYRILKSIDERIIVVPAHAWTPWYSVFGSKSGFDSLEECFGEMTKHVYAIETGLSSDPKMNWNVSGLDSVALISNSDAHSLDKLGREANVFQVDAVSYDEFVRILREKDMAGFRSTIEFFPEEGKYHMDGCASCHFSCNPKESVRVRLTCPKCGRALTLGVEFRIGQLSDRHSDGISSKKVPYRSAIPLKEVIAGTMGIASPGSKRVALEYDRLIDRIGNELFILLDAQIGDIARESTIKTLAETISRIRDGDVVLVPGYDGIFGSVRFADR